MNEETNVRYFQRPSCLLGHHPGCEGQFRMRSVPKVSYIWTDETFQRQEKIKSESSDPTFFSQLLALSNGNVFNGFWSSQTLSLSCIVQCTVFLFMLFSYTVQSHASLFIRFNSYSSTLPSTPIPTNRQHVDGNHEWGPNNDPKSEQQQLV